MQQRLVEMAQSCSVIMEKASQAFLTSDVAKADEAIALSDNTKEKALALDELVIKIWLSSPPLPETFESWFLHFESAHR